MMVMMMMMPRMAVTMEDEKDGVSGRVGRLPFMFIGIWQTNKKMKYRKIDARWYIFLPPAVATYTAAAVVAKKKN
jgi:hypothetical protein